MQKLKDGEPCGHLGCLNHISHPCEGCGRVGGRKAEPVKDCTTCKWRCSGPTCISAGCEDRRRQAGYSYYSCIGYQCWKAEEIKPEKTWVFCTGQFWKPKKPAPALKPETAWLEDRIKELARAIAEADGFNYDWAKEISSCILKLRHIDRSKFE